MITPFEVAADAAVPASAHSAQEEPAPAAASKASANQVVNVPDIGGDEVEVTEILVKVGDKVSLEQSLITVEGDKASMEVPAPFAGTVTEIQVAVGDKISTGSAIMVFSSDAPAAEKAPAPAPEKPAAPAPAKAAPAAAPSAAPKAKDEFAENSAYVHATPVIRRLAREFGVNLAKVKASGRTGRIVKADV